MEENSIDYFFFHARRLFKSNNVIIFASVRESVLERMQFLAGFLDQLQSTLFQSSISIFCSLLYVWITRRKKVERMRIEISFYLFVRRISSLCPCHFTLTGAFHVVTTSLMLSDNLVKHKESITYPKIAKFHHEFTLPYFSHFNGKLTG